MPPRLARIVESSLYVEDVARARLFYRDVLGLSVLLEGPRLTAMDAGGGTVLLLFHRGASAEGVPTSSGFIPPHDGTGAMHVAFAVEAEALPAWEEHLGRHGVPVESRMSWDRGGRSVYFRDPDGHSIELATPGTWETY